MPSLKDLEIPPNDSTGIHWWLPSVDRESFHLQQVLGDVTWSKAWVVIVQLSLDRGILLRAVVNILFPAAMQLR